VSSPQPVTGPLHIAKSVEASHDTAACQQPARSLIAVGLLGLGILALRYGDFAMVWQPVPSFPGRTAVAYASGVLMLLIGVGLMFKATASLAARVLLPYLVVWAALKLPAIIVAPKMEAVYLGLGELTVLLAGGWILFCRLVQVPPNSKLSWLAGERGVRAAIIMFGVSVIPIGLSHLFYVQPTADLVPAWLPYRSGWAYLTGVGHIAAGLGVLLSVFPRMAAAAEAAMISIFTLLVWVPAIVRGPKERLAWTAFFISWIIAAAAWEVAQNVPSKRSTTLKS
jgi:uncharacterized membrane protein